MRTAPSIRRRAAFTLVEMMVSSALIIFMMYILSTAFVKGLESFRVLKTAGDMQEKLRAVTTVLRTDLCRPHFECSDPAKQGGETLSSLRTTKEDWFPPDKGYFRIWQGDPNNGNMEFPDGVDPDDPTASHLRATDHVLEFTVRLNGKRLHEFFSVSGANLMLNTTPAAQPVTAYNSPEYMRPMAAGTAADFTTTWAVVTYYLRPYDVPLYTAATGNVQTKQRFALYRRVKLLADVFDDANFKSSVTFVGTPSSDQLSDLSTWKVPTAGKVFMNRPQDVTAPVRRPKVVFGPRNATATDLAGRPLNLVQRLRQPQSTTDDPYNPASPQAAGDLLLSDVLDFEVKATWEAPPQPNATQRLLPVESNARKGWPVETGNPDFPFDALPVSNRNTVLAGNRVFDTWSKEKLDTPVPGVTPYDYGGASPTDGSQTTTAWNGGHFKPLPGPSSVPPPAASQLAMPLRVRVRALQIEIRIWDVKSKQTRQVTVIQDV